MLGAEYKKKFGLVLKTVWFFSEIKYVLGLLKYGTAVFSDYRNILAPTLMESPKKVEPSGQPSIPLDTNHFVFKLFSKQKKRKSKWTETFLWKTKFI